MVHSVMLCGGASASMYALRAPFVVFLTKSGVGFVEHLWMQLATTWLRAIAVGSKFFVTPASLQHCGVFCENLELV